MKKHFIHTLLWLLIGTALFSCRREADVDPVNLDKDKVKVSLSLNLSQRQQIKSSSTDDDYIDAEKIYLLVFNVDADEKPTTLREVSKALSTGVSANQGIVSFTSILTPSESKSAIYVVANFDVTTAVGTTFEAVRNALKTNNLAVINDEITTVPPIHPMISNIYPMASIAVSFSIGTAVAPVKLYRNTVKVNASTIEMEDKFFKLESIALYNAPVAGYLFPNVELAKTLDRHPYATSLKQTWDENTKKTGDILCYEAPLQANDASKKSPFVIIKGQYDDREGYYRVELMQKDVAGKLNEVALLRNCIFTFSIKKVQRSGYATIDEAILNTASNAIVYDVFVEDLFSSDIISNGEQYLGVSNSEVVVHSDANVKAENILAVTVTYTTKSNWTTPGKITCSQGITLVSGSVIPLEQNSVNGREDTDVYISLEDDFISGDIMLSIGDLYKKIKVRRSKLPSNVPMTYDGGFMEVTHQAETNYKPILMAEVFNPHVSTWLRLATTGSRADARSKIVLKHDITGQPSQNLFIHVWGNEDAIHTTNAIPKGYFFVSYANDHGRTRYCVIKEVTELSFDANEGHGQPANMYEWVKQSVTKKMYILLPQVEPMYEGFIFKGWSRNSDGSGEDFQPNTLYTTTFGARDVLYAKWEAKPVLVPFIFVGGLYWSVGNLVANGANAAKVGAPTQEGLMFKFGSLIGFDRGIQTAALKPADCNILSPDVKNTLGVGFTVSGALPVLDNTLLGVGDPCRYYLGSTWRLPKKADYDALRLTSTNYKNSAMQIEGVNQEAARTNLILPSAGMYRRDGPTNWLFSPNTIYQTTVITPRFGFNNSGGTPVGDGLTDSYSLGAVRCVRIDHPNIP